MGAPETVEVPQVQFHERTRRSYAGRPHVLHDYKAAVSLKNHLIMREKSFHGARQEFLNRHDLLTHSPSKLMCEQNLDQKAEASASSSQLASTGKPVTLKSRTVLDQQKEREVKNEDEENDQASTGKPVTLKKKKTLLDQQKEQEAKYQDGGDDHASTVKFNTINSGILDFRS